ncbi:MAG: metal-sensitive transcriptional regulator [Candidatus Colwellbacteria bacterium]|nr:metal-sensitive transcriptional regulator [Candidatus Colwellbacteria bacterium]
MDKKIKNRAVRRLKVIEGQIRGLEKMVAEEKYCIDVLNQSLAAREALSSFESLILENHLKTCVGEQFKAGQKAKAVREVLSVYKLSRQK